MEWPVIIGLKNFIPLFSEHLEWIIEIDPFAIKKQGGSIAELFKIFRDNGYYIYSIENNYDPTWYFNKNPKGHIKQCAEDVNTMTDIIISKRNPSLFLT